MKCYYHKSDLDGHCSGEIVKFKYPECECIGAEYNSIIDFKDVEEGETVFVVDFSFERQQMEYLNKKANLIWIDHHKSAIEKCDGLDIKGIREIGLAGCELTWGYIYPDKEIPVAVTLLGRYDVWDHEDVGVLPFQYGVRTCENTLPGSHIWDNVFAEVPKYIKIGKIILEYEKIQNAKIANGMYYEKEFEGYQAIIINKPFSNSKVFDSVYDSEKHDIMVVFGVKDGKYKYSLYSDKEGIDVSNIAVKYGGGGHAGAAGFYSNSHVV